MVIEQDDGNVLLALEDIAWLIIDTPQATLTTPLVSACMEAGIAVVTTDSRHMPSGLLLPFHRHHKQAAVAALQVGVSVPLRKRLWQALARTKITNQAAVLEALGRAESDAVSRMAELVGSGDPDNVEARAARAYWTSLWDDFKRGDASDPRNIQLNYAYSVLRACVARALVGSGFLPAFGLHHESATNPFNLADDLIEPFRPFADYLVWNMSVGAVPTWTQLTREVRQTLASLPLRECRIGGDRMTLLAASERCSESLVRAIESKTATILELPLFES